MKRFFYLSVIVFLTFTLAGPLSAQEAVNGEVETINVENENSAEAIPESDVAEDVNYSYGTVVSITGDQLVVLEYDYDKDAEVEITYEVPATVEFNNVQALADLKKDDNIEIYYKEVEEKKIAEIIALEILTPEDEIEEETDAMPVPPEIMEPPMDALPEGEAVPEGEGGPAASVVQ